MDTGCDDMKVAILYPLHEDFSGKFLDWKEMQMKNCYFYLDKKGKIVLIH